MGVRTTTTATLMLALIAGCSAVIDSDQYVGGGGMDAGPGVDSGPGVDDGGPDSGEDLCEGVMCGIGEMCDPFTGDCIERCDPACAEDELCIGGSCTDCDVDDDGFFREGVQCAPLRRMAPPDCDDGNGAVHPDAPVVCGDGAYNACPDETIASALEAAGGGEVGRMSPFPIEGASVQPEHPFLSAELGDPTRGFVTFLSPEGPAFGRYDLTARVGAVTPFDDSGIDTSGAIIGSVASAFRSGEYWIAAHFTPSAGGGDSEVRLFHGDGSDGAWSAGGSEVANEVFYPLAVGLDGSGPAAIYRENAFGEWTITRFSGTVGRLPAELDPEFPFLEALGDLVLAPSAVDGSVIFADVNDNALVWGTEAGVVGTPGVAIVDPERPAYVATVPTNDGIRSIAIGCDTGFPLDLASCEISNVATFGPPGVGEMHAAAARADALVLVAANVPGPEEGTQELALHLLRSDGTPIPGPGGSPVSFPLMVAEELGFGPVFRDVDAVGRFFGDSNVVVFAATVDGGSTGGQELWLSAVKYCLER